MSAGVCLLFFISSTEITKRLRSQQLMVNPVKSIKCYETKSVVVVVVDVVVVYFSFRFSITD